MEAKEKTLKVRSVGLHQGNEVIAFASSYRRIMNLLRASNKHRRVRSGVSNGGARGKGKADISPANHLQRASIRMAYAKNKGDGQWRAHGKYIARESANAEHEKNMGFSSEGAIHIADTLESWQKANDEHLFKFILSPEFGDKMDMQQYTCDVVSALERDLGTSLEWVAIDHYNTDHPHVHLVVRGREKNGQTLRIDPEYVKHALRERGRQAATNQLGFRTESDISDTLNRQIGQDRYTDLDRMILKMATEYEHSEYLHVSYDGNIPKNDRLREVRIKQIKRLTHLETRGLAERTGHMRWRISKSLETALRQMQIGNDRLKSLHQNRVTFSDPRLQIHQTDLSKTSNVAGRLIGTGLDEAKQKTYMLVEGVDGKVHYMYQPKQVQEARGRGLKIDDFIILNSSVFIGNDGKERSITKLTNLGNSQALLTDNQSLIKQALLSVNETKTLPTVQGYGGWLGSYQKILHQTAQSLLIKGLIRQSPQGYSVTHFGKQFKNQERSKAR
jgi:type IV secretory pathway VirD2 relaxase